MSLLSDVELQVAQRSLRAIKHLLGRGMGTEVRLWEAAKDVHQDAYGSASGSRSGTYRTIRGIATGDDFFPYDASRSGSFQEGWLWTDDEGTIKAGQEVEFMALDGRSRRYVVGESQGIGQTTEVFTRYRLSAVDKP